MPGLIDRILNMGSERPELVKEYQGAIIGGERVTMAPKDLASVITILRPRGIASCLSLEGISSAGAAFLCAELGASYTENTEKKEKEFRKAMRSDQKAYDLITLDPRGLPLGGDELWKYIEGGGPQRRAKFGVGAPTDYGTRKFTPNACIIVNRSGEDGAALWFRLRARYSRIYQSAYMGVVHVRP